MHCITLILILLGCPAEPWIGDGYCNDATNIEDCQFDGGDCCLDNENIILALCTVCLCHETGIQATLAPGGTFLLWFRDRQDLFAYGT
jgi:hypothetical protein